MKTTHNIIKGLVAALLLTTLGAGQVQAATPTVDGRFFGDGDSNNYFFLNADPGRGAIYYRIVGTRLYAAVVVSNTVNDNVFGDEVVTRDRAYLNSAGWTRSKGHSFKDLLNSDNLAFKLTIGASSWTWGQDYLQAPAVSGGLWTSDNNGADADRLVTGAPPAGTVSASSMTWNMNNSPWDMTLGGTRTANDTWKSPDDIPTDNTVTNNFWPRWDPVHQWEWSMVYEMSFDISSYPGQAFSLEVVSAHNSPNKNGYDAIIPPTFIYDYGDLPDGYKTTLAANGPRHKIVLGGPLLGASVDADANGAPGALALGDDLNDSTDDEDGVTFLSPVVPGSSTSIRVVGTPGAKLDAWIDWDNNGVFGAGEQIAASAVIAASGTNLMSVSVPVTTVTTAPLYARFRLSTAGALLPTGLAENGEVEDYIIAASIGDRAWLDTDKDGIQDAGEVGIGNVKIELYRIVGGTTNLLATQLTDANGGYFFDNNGPGFYLVKFYLPDATYQFSPRDQGADDAVDSDVNIVTGTSLSVTLLAGESNRTIDAGMTVKTTLATVIGFDAVLRDDGAVAVQWQTSSEQGTLGYYVERLDEAAGSYTRVNAVLVPAKIMVQGVRSYTVVDSGAVAGGTYSYRLVELETTGTTNTYGPYVVTVGGGASGGDQTRTTTVEAAPVPLISTLTAGTGHMILRWSSVAGQTFRLERSGDLTSFETVAAGIPATAPENVTVVVDGAQAGFYRVTVE